MTTNASVKTPCIDCAQPSYGERCRPCLTTQRQARMDPETIERRRTLQRRRAARERLAPGLTIHQRRALLAKWKRQHRACAYCPSLATQVDHVVPLALGGTNYEGNLAPACSTCNTRKNDSLLIAWRHGRQTVRPPRTTVVLSPKRQAKPKTWRPERPLFSVGYQRKQKTPRPCVKCGQVFVALSARYCSEKCRPSHLSGAQQRKRRRERGEAPSISVTDVA